MVDFARWETKLAKFVRRYGATNLAGDLGIQRSAIYHWIAGKYRPHSENARKMVALAKGIGMRLSFADVYAHSDRFQRTSSKSSTETGGTR